MCAKNLLNSFWCYENVLSHFLSYKVVDISQHRSAVFYMTVTGQGRNWAWTQWTPQCSLVNRVTDEWWRRKGSTCCSNKPFNHLCTNVLVSAEPCILPFPTVYWWGGLKVSTSYMWVPSIHLFAVSRFGLERQFAVLWALCILYMTWMKVELDTIDQELDPDFD